MKHSFNVQFKYGYSRGRDSEGYRICSLYIDGVKVAMTVGAGYDQRGTVLGSWLSKNFQAELRKLPANYGSLDKSKGFYGLVHYSNPGGRVRKATKETKTYVDGMCGEGSVYRIMDAIGVTVNEVSTRKERA